MKDWNNCSNLSVGKQIYYIFNIYILRLLFHNRYTLFLIDLQFRAMEFFAHQYGRALYQIRQRSESRLPVKIEE